MANENMIRFLRGNVASLPQTATAGALYFTKDEGVYMGMEDGSYHRYGDFITVADVNSLPTTGAHATCMYYCTAENILARYDSVNSKWIQINKQPTAEEMKTLLGLGSMAYKSEVAEADLNADLKAKVNAAAEGNHSHANKGVLDGITAEKVAAWDAAEGNAKGHADNLNTAMNTRVEALEAIDHDHTNKALLDTYTQTEANLADAVAKKHSHVNADELAKIADGDKAKWDAVAADHLTSADKTTLEDAIKEAKKAGTDANTNVETYKVTNDARVKAVEDDIAEITAAEGGILAQAKAYADGKDGAIAEAKAAGTTAQSNLEAYQTSNNEALAGVKATAEAAATKTYTDEELAKKVDKVTGKSLVDDAEITKLAGVSAGANKVEASENGKIKIDGVDTVVYTHPDKHAIADVDGLQAALDGKQAAGDYAAEVHTHVKADITDFAHTHTASEVTDLDATIKGYGYATKTEAQGYADAKDEAIATAKAAADKAQEEVDALETYVGAIPTDEKYADITNVISYINKKSEETLAAAQGGSSETAASVKQQLDNYKSENDTRVKTAEDAIDAIEADYLKAADKTELSGLITAEKERAEGIEAGLRTDVDAIKGDYLKAEDKEALQNQINTIMNNPDTEGVINSINEFTQYITDHGEIADGFRADIDQNKKDIAANTKAIEDHESLAAQTYETKEDATAKFNEVKAAVDAIPQADWNQNDPTAADYVKNRTHYDNTMVVPFVQDIALSAGTDGPMGTTDWTYETGVPFNPKFDYCLLFDGGFYHVTSRDLTSVTFDGIPHPADSAQTMYFTVSENKIRNYGLRNVTFDRGDLTFSIEAILLDLKQLEDKFIPDTIARTSVVNLINSRVQTLEAIDHDAYVGADSALKAELQKEIDDDVKALADTVYTKSEVDAMFTWGTFGS